MTWTLQAKLADGEKRFLLEPGREYVVGRHESCDICLMLPRMSRQHFRLHYDQRKWHIKDLGSRNGTQVNGEHVDSRVLKVGDVIGAGDIELKILREPKEAPANPFATTTILPPKATQDASAASTRASKMRLGRRYELEEVFHRGATGVFYRARDLRHNRRVCVKVLTKRTSADEGELQRFVRGFRTARKLHHPNIVELYDAGRSRRGQWWLAMELVDGPSVRQLAAKIGVSKMLSLERVVKIARDVIAALEAAYKRNVVHRNIKPDNILLTTQDVAKLSNFTLSRGVVLTTLQQITTANEVVGDLAYTPPEGLEPSGQIDCRSDIYSLGACLYTLLCGHPPFTGSSMLDLADKVRREEPTPPSKINLSVGGPMEGLVLRCLEKSPTERYQSPAELASDLERVARFRMA